MIRDIQENLLSKFNNAGRRVAGGDLYDPDLFCNPSVNEPPSRRDSRTRSGRC